MMQQEDLKKFQTLEAQATNFDIDMNSRMNNPKFHALLKKAQEYIPDIHVNSPLSADNSSRYQNPLNNARVGDDDEWDEYLGDEIETAQEELAAHLESVLNSKKERKSLIEEEDRSVSNQIQERVKELENEITEYQRLNAVMRRQECERQREQSELNLKLDKFEEYRKSELERKEKDSNHRCLL